MRIFNAIGALALAATFAFSTASFAKDDDSEYAEINDATMVADFNGTWTAAKDVQTAIGEWETNLNEANTKFKEAVGAAQDQTLDEAVAKFKEVAGDQLKVAIDGGKVGITLDDAAPDDAKAAAEALEASAAAAKKIVDSAPELVEKSKAVGEQAAAIPGQLNPAFFSDNGIKVKDIKKATKEQNDNLKATKATDERIKGVIGEAQATWDAVSGLAG
ncbi:MAG: hypothetical protein GY913_32515 [Proteobacteria bacterium]|nr:hypothetical protein [Pseudomonadota bacterium]MCP4921646.1 hypothetical protein [Pseudomonadota bacterium]